MTARNESLHVLQHALGLDDYGQGTWYRNHYVCGPGHHGYDLCMEHVAAGRMERHAPRAMFGGDYCFTVTDRGKAYVREQSPAPEKMTVAKARYRKWLRSGVDMTFGEWLKAGGAKP